MIIIVGCLFQDCSNNNEVAPPALKTTLPKVFYCNQAHTIGLNYKRDGWTTSNVNVRIKPFTDSDIIQVLGFNEQVVFSYYNFDWVKVELKDQDEFTHGYISSKYISSSECNYIEYNLPENNGFKSFMPYQTISDKSSSQYKLQTEYAYTGNYGIRMVNNRYCVAIGTKFGLEIGTYFDLLLENGEAIKCIIADVKDDKDTDYDNIITIENGCVCEFIVDINHIPSDVKINGDISYCCNEWNSSSISIKMYDKNIFN